MSDFWITYLFVLFLLTPPTLVVLGIILKKEKYGCPLFIIGWVLISIFVLPYVSDLLAAVICALLDTLGIAASFYNTRIIDVPLFIGSIWAGFKVFVLISKPQKIQSKGHIAPSPTVNKRLDSQPNQEAICYMEDTNSKHSAAYEVCRLIWQEVDMYIKYVDQSIDRKQRIYLWTAYFYVVVKAVRDKNFINDIYSYFATFAIRHGKDPACNSFLVQEMRRDYREIRPLLNASGIVPDDASGRRLLWALINAQMYKYGDVPTNADRQFEVGTIRLREYSLHHYRNRLPTNFNVKYSLDSSVSEDSLPDA